VIIGLQQLNGLLERLKHVISGSLPVLDGHQVTHDPNQTVIVILTNLNAKTTLSNFDEIFEVIQTIIKLIS
jgi:hypothetical protein